MWVTSASASPSSQIRAEVTSSPTPSIDSGMDGVLVRMPSPAVDFWTASFWPNVVELPEPITAGPRSPGRRESIRKDVSGR
jgi:hypothetical protein